MTDPPGRHTHLTEVDMAAAQHPSSSGCLTGASRRTFLQLTAVAGVGAFGVLSPSGRASAKTPTFTPVRPPAIPLAVRSPYLSTWLRADNPSGAWPTFWTGHVTAFSVIARVDGSSYVLMGSPALPNTTFPAFREVGFELTPTHSNFTLQQAGVQVVLSFFSPVEPGDLPRQSMPLSYLSATASSTDGKAHSVQLYFDISGEWAHGNTGTPITWDQESYSTSGAAVNTLKCQPNSPQMLSEDGDMASWGSVVWTAPDIPAASWQTGQDITVRQQFVSHGSLTGVNDTDQPRAISDRWPVFAHAVDLGPVRSATAPFVLSIGHVRTPAVSYLGHPLPPLWQTYYSSTHELIGAFHAGAAAAESRAKKLDSRITAAATKAGGAHYAALCAVALRQAYGGTELVSNNGKPWAFCKEISSDGNMSTVDILYPAFPVFAYLDPAFLTLLLEPVLDYAETGGWPKEFAPHDLGSSYPNATGHNDGNEEDMPVEESANMLLMVAAALQGDGVADTQAYASSHYRILRQWAEYLVQNALDPGFQNQTDDFTGFIAHSVNLALKGILAIGAMAQIATVAGNTADAARYTQISKDYIRQWVTKSMDSSGKHLKLAYDRDGTWSLKYNGFPDQLLGLGLIPASVQKLEAAWYLSHANTYGVPLDPRHTYTKADWEMWTAGWLASDKTLRGNLIGSLYQFANTTGSRVPMTDWYDTLSNASAGFQARPVVGGFFALLALG